MPKLNARVRVAATLLPAVLLLVTCDRDKSTGFDTTGSIVIDAVVPSTPTTGAGSSAKIAPSRARVRVSGEGMTTLESLIAIVDGRVRATLADIPVGERTVSIDFEDSSGERLWEGTTKVAVIANQSSVATLQLQRVRNIRPEVSGIVISPTTVTVETLVSFQADVEDLHDATDLLEVRWDFDNDGTFEVDWTQEKSHQTSFASAGTFTTKLEVKDRTGLINTVTREIEVLRPNAAPVALVEDVPAEVVLGETTVIRGKGTDQEEGALLYRWRGDRVEAVLSDTASIAPAFTPDVAGEYTFIFVVIDENMVESAPVEITINVLPPDPVAAFIANPTSGKIPLRVTLTNNSQYGETYLWSFGTGDTSGDETPSPYSYSEVGIYTIVLEVFGAQGKIDSARQEISVTDIDRPDLWVEQIRLESETGTEISLVNENQQVAFRISVFNGGTVTADDFELQVFLDDGNDPLFSFRDLSLDAQVRTQHVTALWSATAGNHVLRAVVVVPASAVADGNIANNALEVSFGVNAPPTANAGVDQSAVVDGEVFLDGTSSADPDGCCRSSEDALTYLWSQVAGTAVTLSDVTVVAPAFTPTESGTYTFSLVVNDGELDSEADEVEIRVTDGTTIGTTVSGTVYHANTPVEGAWVGVYGGDGGSLLMETASSSSGTYEFSELSPGYYVLAVLQGGDYSWYVLKVESQAVSGFDIYSENMIRIPPDYDGVVTTQNPALEWEPLPEATGYDVSLYVMDTRELVESTTYPPGVDGTTYEVRSELDIDTEYLWEVIAYDADSRRVGSVRVTFRTPLGFNLDRTIRLKSPPNGAVVTTLSPVLEWEPIPEAAEYNLALSVTDPWELVEDAGWGCDLPDCVAELTTTIYDVRSELEPDTDYTWGVGAFDKHGNEIGNLETTFQFRTPVPRSNAQPIANAGPDQSVGVGAEIFLDGTSSADPDGDALTYIWSQVEGTAVTLIFNSSVDNWPAKPYLASETGSGTYTFSLVVNDGELDSEADEVEIRVTGGTTVSGTVYYASTPVEGVTVELWDENNSGKVMETTSSSSGAYEFSGVPPGEYWVRIYGPSEDFFTWNGSEVTVGSQGATNLGFSLIKRIKLTSPLDGAIVTTLSPVLEWEPIPEATKYDLSIHVTDPWELVEDAGWRCDLPDCVAELTTTIYDVRSVLEPNTHYTWGVGAFDTDGNHIGSTSRTFTFWTPGIAAPVYDEDVDAAGGTTVSGIIYYSTTTPVEGITVELLPDSPFSPPVMTTTSSSSGAYEFSAVPPGEYWVKISDPNEVYLTAIFRGDQAGRGLIVQDQARYKELYVFKPLGLISPLDGAVVTTLRPVLEWESSPEATTYTLVLYVYRDELEQLERLEIVSDLTTTSYEGFELEADTEYRWTVVAYDETQSVVAAFKQIRDDNGILERRFNFWTPGDEDATDGTTVSGTVYYASTPVEGVRVELRDNNDDVIMETTSSSSGAYEFSEVELGSYVVKYYAPSEEYHSWFTDNVDVYSEAVIQDLYLLKNIILTSPPHGAVVTTLHPVLEWEPNPEAITYKVRLNVTDTWELVELVIDIENNIYEVTSELEPDTDYTWGVSGHDIDGNEVGYSWTRDFRTPAGD